MTPKNPYLINDRLPETATVFNIEEWDKNSTFEELKQQGIISDSYVAEWEEWGKMNGYGPGFGSWIAKVAITTGAGIILGPAAIPVGAAVWGGSEIVKECCDDEDVKKVCDFISDCGRDTLTGGAIGVAAQGAGAVAGFNKFAGLGKNVSGSFNSAVHGIKVAGTIEFWISKGFEAKDAIKHVDHKNDGIEYKVGCKVCEG